MSQTPPSSFICFWRWLLGHEETREPEDPHLVLVIGFQHCFRGFRWANGKRLRVSRLRHFGTEPVDSCMLPLTEKLPPHRLFKGGGGHSTAPVSAYIYFTVSKKPSLTPVLRCQVYHKPCTVCAGVPKHGKNSAVDYQDEWSLLISTLSCLFRAKSLLCKCSGPSSALFWHWGWCL